MFTDYFSCALLYVHVAYIGLVDVGYNRVYPVYPALPSTQCKQ